MSVTVATNQQPATWLQRLTGTEPKTVIRETSTTEVTSVPGGSFNVKAALRNGGIGAAVAGVLGGVSLLGKIALPVIGKVGSLGGLAKLAGVGGALGVATAAIPLIAPKVKESPAAKATLIGAGIGAAAGAVLPLMPTWLGAAIGAGVGLLVHNRRNAPAPTYPTYPGYAAYPGFSPVGIPQNGSVPTGMVSVTPNYGSYAGAAMNPYGSYGIGGYGYPTAMSGYGAMVSPYGTTNGYYGLPMQAAGQQQIAAAQPQVVAATPAQPAAGAAAQAKPAKGKPKFPNAKTWIDKSGNVRQVGTGKVIKAAATSNAASVAAATPTYATGIPSASSALPTSAASYALPQFTMPAMPTTATS